MSFADQRDKVYCKPVVGTRLKFVISLESQLVEELHCKREVSIRACSISKLITPQQQCLLLFFLKLPVDQATSKIPPVDKLWNPDCF